MVLTCVSTQTQENRKLLLHSSSLAIPVILFYFFFPSCSYVDRKHVKMSTPLYLPLMSLSSKILICWAFFNAYKLKLVHDICKVLQK